MKVLEKHEDIFKQPGSTTFAVCGAPYHPLKSHRHKKLCEIRTHGRLGPRGKSLSHMGEYPAVLEAQRQELTQFLPGFSAGDMVLRTPCYLSSPASSARFD